MNMGLHLTRSARSFAGRTALVFENGRVTFAEFNEHVNRLANGLIGLGLGKGDRVALLSKNCPQLVEAFYACYKAGLVTVPLNSRASTAEILHMLNHAEVGAILLGREFNDRIDSISGAVSPNVHLITLTGGDERILDAGRLPGSPLEPAVQVNSEDLAELRYTSGTSGVMKAAMLTHGNLLAKARKHMLVPGIDIGRDSVICHSAPVTHASGGWILPFISRGGCNVLLDRFEAGRLLQTIDREQVTHLFLVPTQLTLMMEEPDFHQYNLSSIRTIVYGASPMPPGQIQAAVEVFGPVLVQGYGQSETGSGFIFLEKEDHLCAGDAVAEKRLASVGLPSFECEVRVVDSEGQDVLPGQVGEIIEKGAGNMAGYWKDPELTARILRDGWIHTGDLATVDESGYIYIVDRKSDMIISGGFNIFPAEVEGVLREHPAVKEVAVIGLPDDQWGEAVCAFVVPAPGSGPSEEEIIEHCRGRLTGFKKPRKVIFVEALPKNSNGKVLRRTLKQRMWEGQDRMVH